MGERYNDFLVMLFHHSLLFYFGLSFFSPFLYVFVCLCVSGELAASGQHRVQCSWPAGTAAAWQGMALITALFLFEACQPTLSALHHPRVALYTVIQLGIPSRPGLKQHELLQIPSVYHHQITCESH